MFEFKPLPFPAQSRRGVLFFNAHASALDLFDTAQQRMGALGDLLHVLENSENFGQPRQEIARLAAAFGLLLADAQALYEAAYDRAREEGQQQRLPL